MGFTMPARTTPTSSRHDAPTVTQTLTTEQAAAAFHVRPQTLRAALCRDGHYLGIRPSKGPNRFLLWPADKIGALIAGDQA